MKALLVVNAGSSSLKFALFGLPLIEGAQSLFRGQIDGIGADAQFKLRDANDAVCLDQRISAPAGSSLEEQHQISLDAVLAWLGTQDIELVGVGHRVVHGGSEFSAPVRLDAEVLAKLDALCALAPLHQSHNLRPVKALMKRFPTLPQVACFDTAFHRTQSPLAEAFAIPRAISAEGVKRYGFHGSSYEYVSREMPKLLGDKAKGAVVIAHLGNGASMAALRDGKSIGTTMGFTAVDGLMMGTRTGALDPGVLLYLIDQHGYDSKKLTNFLYKESGLLGVSGISQDMRTLEASDAPEAKEAIDLFCYRAAREIGSLAVAAGGLDAVVFTGGIGENACNVRARILGYLAWLGLEVDAEANSQRGKAMLISKPGSRVLAAVLPTNEEWMIAHHTVLKIDA
ncbi:acetate/propionate family kinase [Viridibacterium curvum]|uniref:Acetate kinase n=1 Tax=Viridibacterium curvum TaxID=1101404 RepID=A0ABP9QUP9_9RHOO